MKLLKCSFFSTFLIIFAFSAVSRAAETAALETVRAKAVLAPPDLEIIDKFVAESVDELVNTRDFNSIGKLRIAITSRAASTQSSVQVQYVDSFMKAARKHIAEAFKTAQDITPEEAKFRIRLNLLILTDNLENSQLISLAFPMLTDGNTVIQYWAVHCVTNLKVVEQLKSQNGALNKVIEQLKPNLDKLQPEALTLVVNFAVKANGAEGEKLIFDITDMRLNKYINWTVDYELIDSMLLKSLFTKAIAANSAAAERFIQLYSYVLQRYIKGKDFLTDNQKEWLASALVEVDSTCLVKSLEMPPSKIKRAIEQEDYATLSEEFKRLFDDAIDKGVIAEKLNFKAADNKDRRPFVLPNPPETPTEK